jgi:hypothetical protein
VSFFCVFLVIVAEIFVNRIIDRCTTRGAEAAAFCSMEDAAGRMRRRIGDEVNGHGILRIVWTK